MYAVFWFGVCVIFACPIIAQTVTKDDSNQTITSQMQALIPHIGGRVQINRLSGDTPPGAVSYTHQWPGIYWETGFIGDTVVLKFNDPANEYRLLLDDKAPIAIAQPGRSEIAVTNFANGPHRLRLEKVTESIWKLGTFEGFYINATEKGVTIPPKLRQIEFIGNSDMTGYGLRSDTRTCTQDEVRLRSDTQSAYPALVAKFFDADYQINAISGRGIIRNYAGMVPDHTMLVIYDNILPDEPGTFEPYADATWTPQITFIGLGGNDFFSPLKPDEVWKTRDALIDSYVDGMAKLLANVQQRHPKTTVMIYWPDAGILTPAEKARLDRDGQARLVTTARLLGMKPLEFVVTGNLEPDAMACDYHGSASDHRKKARWLIDRIQLQMTLWAAK